MKIRRRYLPVSYTHLNEIQIKDNINVNLESDSNSLIIEEREIKLNDGKKTNLQFVSTADMQKDAKDLDVYKRQDYNDSTGYDLFVRCLSEQTIVENES